MAVKVDEIRPAGQLYVAEGGWKAGDKVLLPVALAANGQPGHESRERLRVAVRPADWREPACGLEPFDNCTKMEAKKFSEGPNLLGAVLPLWVVELDSQQQPANDMNRGP